MKRRGRRILLAGVLGLLFLTPGCSDVFGSDPEPSEPVLQEPCQNGTAPVAKRTLKRDGGRYYSLYALGPAR